MFQGESMKLFRIPSGILRVSCSNLVVLRVLTIGHSMLLARKSLGWYFLAETWVTIHHRGVSVLTSFHDEYLAMISSSPLYIDRP